MELIQTKHSASKKTMTVKEFASLYGIGLNKAYQMVNTNNFPKLLCGKRIVILSSKIDLWIESQIGKEF